MELRLATTGVVWVADLEAQGAEHLRVKLRNDALGVLPVLVSGTSLECTMRSGDGNYYVTGSVIEQQGAIVWLSLPPVWRKHERREFARQTGGFAVKYSGLELDGIGSCVDVSAGGMKLRVKQPLPKRFTMELLFTLPGEGLPVRVTGLALHCFPVDEDEQLFDAGVKFLNLEIGDAVRIARYCGG